MNVVHAGWIEPLGLTLLHFLWQGAVIGLLFAFSLAATRHATAATRYLTATVTLAALALAPVATLALLLTGQSSSNASPIAPLAMLVQVGAPEAGASSAGWMAWIVAAWLAGVLLLTGRLLLGWVQIWRLRRSADFDATRSLKPQLTALIRRLGIHRPVALAVSRSIHSPVVIGLLKPLVLLPPAIVTGLPTRQIEMVLAHELAHVRRFDHLVNLAQTVIETALFYHPVVRWVSSRIRIERENACDDLAVAMTSDRLSYVEMLASLERMRFDGPRLALAVHDGQMLSRIRRLVERSRPSSQLGLTGPALLAVLVAILTVGAQWADVPAPGPSVEATASETLQSGRPMEPSKPLPAIPAAADESGEAGPESAAPATSRPDDAPTPADTTGASVVEADLPAATKTSESTSGQNRAVEDNAGTVQTASAEPPPLPSMPRDRLPPVESLIETAGQRQLAMVERPGLSMPELPEPEPEQRLAAEPDGLSGGNILERIEPEYPDGALRRSLDGVVEVTFVVTRDGSVRDIRVVEESPRGQSFGQSARRALADWRFEPFSRGGETIERRVRLEMAFDVAQARESQCRDILGSRIPRCY